MCVFRLRDAASGVFYTDDVESGDDEDAKKFMHEVNKAAGRLQREELAAIKKRTDKVTEVKVGRKRKHQNDDDDDDNDDNEMNDAEDDDDSEGDIRRYSCYLSVQFC